MSKIKKQNTYFTVVIPTLNEEKHLPKLLEDLSEQTFKNFEVIVVDAKSKDKTWKIATDFKDLTSKIKVITSVRKNVSYQRNLGSKISNSDWIIFIDADTRIPKSYLHNLKIYSETLNADIFSTWIRPDSNTNQDKLTATIMNIFMDINKNTSNPYILESMLVVKKKSFEILGGFDTSIHWSEGEDLLRRARKKGMKFEYLKKPKYTYSFRRLKKSGSYKVLQNIALMEISKIINSKTSKKKAKIYYPMEGGEFYKTEEKQTSKLQKFISIIFQDIPINKRSIRLFEKSLNPWKSFFG